VGVLRYVHSSQEAQAAAAAQAEAAAAANSGLQAALESKAKDLQVQTQRTVEQTHERKQVRCERRPLCAAAPRSAGSVWSDPLARRYGRRLSF